MTIGGVDVGGMDAAEASASCATSCCAPLRKPLKVGYDGESWKLPGKKLKVHADIDGAVDEALDASRDGGLPGRLVRYVTGGTVDESIAADVGYSQPAVNRFVRHVAGEIDRDRRTPRSARRRLARSGPGQPAASCATTCSTEQLTAVVSGKPTGRRIPAKCTRPSRR